MIRHASPLDAVTLAILALPVAMVEAAFGTALMTLIGASALFTSGMPAARFTAIAMAAVAV